MKQPSTKIAWALALGLVLTACTSPPSAEGGKPLAEELTPPKLYVRQASPHADSSKTPMVIPGASWLEYDLDPLLAEQPTIFYDMRGRGRSSVVPDSEGMSIARDVADLELLRTELGLERMALFAWAYGAQVIVRYAMQFPERVERLVLVGPLPPKRAGYWKGYLRGYALRFKTEDRDAINALRASKTKLSNPELYCRRVQEASLRTFVDDDSCLEGMRTRPWVLPNLDPELGAQHAQAILKQLGDWDWTEELGRLQLPVLVVHGSEELLPLASSEAYVDALPGGQLLQIEGAGHMPWLERPEQFFPPVLRFLASGTSEQEPTEIVR